MRIGGLRGATGIVLIVVGALAVVAAILTPITADVYGSVVKLLLGVALCRAGQLVRATSRYAYHLAVGALLVLIAAPFVLHNRPTRVAAIVEVSVLLLTVAAWARASRVPGA